MVVKSIIQIKYLMNDPGFPEGEPLLPEEMIERKQTLYPLLQLDKAFDVQATEEPLECFVCGMRYPSGYRIWAEGKSFPVCHRHAKRARVYQLLKKQQKGDS